MDKNTGNGILNIKIDFDTTNGGDYHFFVEENGIPTSVPAYVIVGILDLVKTNIVAYGVLDDELGDSK